MPGGSPVMAGRPGPWRDAAFEAGQVHLWRIDLDHAAPAGWQASLSAAELRRAERFVHRVHRDRFLRGRAWLRSLLSAYTGVAPGALELGFLRHGKPYLPARYALGFNLSHSENLAVAALGRNRLIGIDIERRVLPADPRLLAQQVFSAQESLAFAALPDDALLLPFLTCWTRKEALVKALGAGLTLDLRSITVGLDGAPSTIALPKLRTRFSVATVAADEAAVISLALGGSAAAAPLAYF